MSKIDSVLTAKGIAATYQDAQQRVVKAVDGVSITVARGEVLGLVGESGSGKTSLGKVIAGLLPPCRGSLYLNGKPVKPGFHREVQMVFQDSTAALNPRLQVGSLVEEGLLVQKVGSKEQRRKQMLQILREVGLQAELAGRYPWQLSGGQRQRVALARTLIVLPELVVLDEPVSSLDVTAGARLLALLQNLQQRYGVAYLFISHNLAVVRQICDRVAVMYVGKIVEQGPVDAVYACPAHPYTRLLLEAHPHPDPDILLSNIPDVQPGNPFAPPQGCRFHPRCPLAVYRCSLAAPPFREIGQGHLAACHQAPLRL